jgi:hypothetical protein
MPHPSIARAGVALAAGFALVAAATLPRQAAAQTPEWTVELEAGPIWQSYNDVEIPNDGSATRFSLRDLAGSGPWSGARLYVTWNMAERHGLRLLLAPFSLTETGAPADEVRFAGETFDGGRSTETTYTFNSYRVSYRYRWHEGERSTAWVGGTAKLRDATIALEQDGLSARKDDLGFVPLLHLAGEWRFAPRWRMALDLDGLAGGPGRALDAALEVGYELSDRWSVEGGYRTVEGGADVTEVYTFAWLHSAAVSVIWHW